MNTQKQQSYGDLHKQKKFSAGDKESYINFLEEQLKKLTDSLVDNDNLKERLEAIENKVERISEKSDKFQKINKLLQACVDNQEEDLKIFKDKIYLDMDMKVKVLESKFDVDDKIVRDLICYKQEESNLNKKFNQRQRDFDKIVENFEKKIQINYEEFSTEIAIDLKDIENKVDERMNIIKEDLLYSMKEELENQQRDRQIYTHFQEFRSSVSEQFELQKTELNANFELLNTKSKTQSNEFASSKISSYDDKSIKIEERLQRYEYSGQHLREDDLEQQRQRKDIQDLKYITNLIMEKVEKLESSRTNLRSSPAGKDQSYPRTGSIDKIEKKLANQMSNQFEKLSNIIKQLQDQQFSIEKKITSIDPRTVFDFTRMQTRSQDKQYEEDKVVEDRIQNAITVKHVRTTSNDREQLADKYSLISEKLKQRRLQEEETDLHKSQDKERTFKGQEQIKVQPRELYGQEKYLYGQERESKQLGKQFQERERQFNGLQKQQNGLDRQMKGEYERQFQVEERKFKVSDKQLKEFERDQSRSRSPKEDRNKKEIDRSQNTDSLNESIDELLSKRKSLFNQKPPTGTQQLSSPQQLQPAVGRHNNYAQQQQSSERPTKYSNLIERDSFSSNNQNSHPQEQIHHSQVTTENYSSSIQRQNLFEQRNLPTGSIKQTTTTSNADKFKRRSFDDRQILNTEPRPIQEEQEQYYEGQAITEGQESQKPPQSRLQKSSSLNRFEEIQQRNIQNSPNSQRDENLADHLEQRRERLRKFIQQTDQQLEEANTGFEEKINRKYESMRENHKPTSNFEPVEDQQQQQQFKSLPQKNSQQKFSPYSNDKNQIRGEGFYNKQDNKNDFSDTFDEQSQLNSEKKNKYIYQRDGQNQNDEQEEEEEDYADEYNNEFQQSGNKQHDNFYNKNNQIFQVGDDSDIMRLNNRILTAENNVDSFSRDINPSRSQSREVVQKQKSYNKPVLQNEDKLLKQELKEIAQPSSKNKQIVPKHIDTDSDEEEIQQVLQKYNNTKVNIKDLIEKKKEEERLNKLQQQQQHNSNKPIKDAAISPQLNTPQIERDTPYSKGVHSSSGKKTEGYYAIGNKTRDLLNDDTSYDISASNINQSEFNHSQKQDKYRNQDLITKSSKTNKIISQKQDLKGKQKYNDKSIPTTHQTEPVQQSKKDLDSFFYTKGLKYDFNFSTNTSKTKDQSKSFSMIDKVMNGSLKTKK